MPSEIKHNKLILIFSIIIIAAVLGGGLFVGIRYILQKTRTASGPEITVIRPIAEKPLLLNEINPVDIIAVSHAGQIIAIEWYVDGLLAGQSEGDKQVLNGNWKWVPQQEGTHQLSFLAYDQRGTISLASMTVGVLSGLDLDADGVPDAQDDCPDEVGPAASNGCTLPEDGDLDGLIGEADACSTEAGSPQEFGCPSGTLPDGDGDGISDMYDRCPNDPGILDWEGCPLTAWALNKDGDELPDFLDECPDAYGSRDTSGCPSVTAEDSDGDGTLNTADSCPDIPGFPEGSGCIATSDRDSDGIPDEMDACPEEPGIVDDRGCLPGDITNDADMDGVLDMFDACPSHPGTLDNNGCPLPDDRDGDGVTDIDDNCPDMGGSPENAGCPYIAFPMTAYTRQLSLFPELLNPCDLDASLCRPDDSSVDGMGGGGNGDLDDDGVMDVDDDCPNDRGDPYWGGCPREGDRDTDGISDDHDACPDIAGSAPNGCVNAGQEYHLSFELISFETEPGWQGVYCYGQTNGTHGYIRIPYWDYMGDYFGLHSPIIVIHEDEYVFLDVECWGQPNDMSAHSQYLGSVHRPFTYGFWDGQIRQVMGVGPGGWFKIWFKITPMSWYEM